MRCISSVEQINDIYDIDLACLLSDLLELPFASFSGETCICALFITVTLCVRILSKEVKWSLILDVSQRSDIWAPLPSIVYWYSRIG